MKDILKEITYNKVFSVILILLVTYVLGKIISAILKKFAEKYSQKRIQIKGFIPITKLFVYSTSIFFIVFGVLNISKGTLTALGLSLGVALGFAFQDIIGNLFGGIIIIFVKPFTIGDKIKIGNHYGEVTDISIRRFVLVTSDDNAITVPNKTILTEKVSNANSGELNCQVVTEIYLPYSVDTEKSEQCAYEAVYSSPYSFLKKPVSVVFESTLNKIPVIKMKVKAYVFDHRYEFVFSSDITKRVMKSLRDEKVINEHYFGPASYNA